jgi:ATP-dependent exoDNAse (exonuclease V) alpha subunit
MSQEQALELLQMGENVYLTGTAGSGKTHVLNKYIEYLKAEGIPMGITASTGVAATHIGGITINSWAGIGIHQTLDKSDLAELFKRTYLRNRIKNTQVLIIDEISMLPDYTLDLVDEVCRYFKNSDLPFGNMQVILCGDLFQLPPVTKKDSNAQFIYKSRAWQESDLKVCYLEKEYRQEDENFLHVLHEIRDNAITKPSIQVLAARLHKPVKNISTRLYTHNVDVDAINNRELANLPGKAKRYTMRAEGNEYLAEIVKKSCMAPAVLELKVGALVMFCKNNFDKGYVNGTLGTVVEFDGRGFPYVQTSTGENILVSPSEWTIEEDGEVKVLLKQLPLRLAWAITVHKSQGMSLDAAEIDLSKPFAPGMGYVALSRVRSLEGIRLTGLNHKAFEVNKEIVQLDKTLRAQSQKTSSELDTMDWMEKYTAQSLFLHEVKPKNDKYNDKYSILH